MQSTGTMCGLPLSVTPTWTGLPLPLRVVSKNHCKTEQMLLEYIIHSKNTNQIGMESSYVSFIQQKDFNAIPPSQYRIALPHCKLPIMTHLPLLLGLSLPCLAWQKARHHFNMPWLQLLQPHGFPTSIPTHTPTLASYPYQRIFADYFHCRGYNNLVIVDRYFNWPIVEKITSSSITWGDISQLIESLMNSIPM